MDNSIEKKLCEMPTAKLVKIILASLETMDESSQISFIAKHIDAGTSLTRLGADNPEAFINEVKEFCLSCLNGDYYADEDDIEAYFTENHSYDDYYDEWDYDDYFGDTEWSSTFERLFKLSMMYIQSGDFETGNETMSQLLSCLKEIMSSDEYLGTSEPMTHISADWEDLFTLSYIALFQFHSDSNEAIKLAFERWIDFGSKCDEGFLSNIKDIPVAKCHIIQKIKKSNDWLCQRKCFELLEQLYRRLGQDFDKTSQALALVNYNIFFHLMVVDGLCEKEQWDEAIKVSCSVLPQIQPPKKPHDNFYDTREIRTQMEIRSTIQSRLADAYEQLSDFNNAFEILKQMFTESPSFALYKRTRTLSEKCDRISEFFVFTENLLKKEHKISYMHDNLLRDIYSYEGKTQELLEIATSEIISRNYYDRKYIAHSLIYRAVGNIPKIEGCLAEYLSRATQREGVTDMLLFGDDSKPCVELLLQGADLLKGIISFHIDAATRSRYAKAAYYMTVIRDIFILLEQEDKFREYFKEVILQNNRRPALRDEMSIVYGKDATIVKK